MNSQINIKYSIVILVCISLLVSCDTLYDDNDESYTNDSDSNTINITNKELSNRSHLCSDYVGTYSSSVKDIHRNTYFYGQLSISVSNGKCVFTSNSIPNHNFNDGDSAFVNQTQEVTETFEITTSPSVANSTTSLTLQRDNAIMLNGVKLDLLAAGCYGVSDGKTGCNDSDTNKAWRYDPMSPTNNFGTDIHNAHTQPDGAYHYHGNPNALFDQAKPATESPVIGFAADGYPIYGSYILEDGIVRKVTSSYILKSGNRKKKGNESSGDFPEGTYNGEFIDDYKYVEGQGDLDQCNGMTHNGVYGYYVTDSYPWVLNCFKGTPDSSFNKN